MTTNTDISLYKIKKYALNSSFVNIMEVVVIRMIVELAAVD